MAPQLLQRSTVARPDSRLARVAQRGSCRLLLVSRRACIRPACSLTPQAGREGDAADPSSPQQPQPLHPEINVIVDRHKAEERVGQAPQSTSSSSSFNTSWGGLPAIDTEEDLGIDTRSGKVGVEPVMTEDFSYLNKGQPHKPASATDGAETGCATITHVDSGRVANQREGSCAEQSESQQPSASSASGAGSRSNSQEQQGASAQDEARSVPDMDDF